MENKKEIKTKQKPTVPVAVTILVVVICAISIIFGWLEIITSFEFTLTFANKVTYVLAVICALVYVCMGYSKKGAIYYVLFGTFLLLNELATCFVSFEETDVLSGVAGAICIVSLICIGCLCVGKDMGKVVSYVLVLIVFACYTAKSMITIFLVGPSKSITPILLNLSISIVYVIFVFSKYLDKEKRKKAEKEKEEIANIPEEKAE